MFIFRNIKAQKEIISETAKKKSLSIIIDHVKTKKRLNGLPANARNWLNRHKDDPEVVDALLVVGITDIFSAGFLPEYTIDGKKIKTDMMDRRLKSVIGYNHQHIESIMQWMLENNVGEHNKPLFSDITRLKNAIAIGQQVKTPNITWDQESCKSFISQIREGKRILAEEQRQELLALGINLESQKRLMETDYREQLQGWLLANNLQKDETPFPDIAAYKNAVKTGYKAKIPSKSDKKDKIAVRLGSWLVELRRGRRLLSAELAKELTELGIPIDQRARIPVRERIIQLQKWEKTKDLPPNKRSENSDEKYLAELLSIYLRGEIVNITETEKKEVLEIAKKIEAKWNTKLQKYMEAEHCFPPHNSHLSQLLYSVVGGNYKYIEPEQKQKIIDLYEKINIAIIIKSYRNKKPLSRRHLGDGAYIFLVKNKYNPETRKQLLTVIPEAELDKIGTKRKIIEPDKEIAVIVKYYNDKKSLVGLGDSTYHWLYRVLYDTKKTKAKPEIRKQLIEAGIPEEILDNFGKNSKNASHTKLGIDTNNHTGQPNAAPVVNALRKIKVKESNISAAMRLLGRGRFRKQRLNLSNPDGLNTKDITKKNEYDHVDNEENEAKLLENLVAVTTSKLNKYLNKRTDFNKPKESKPSKQYSAGQTEEHGFNNKMRSIQSAEKDLQELLNILTPEDKSILEKAYQEAVTEIANTNQGTTEWQKTLEYYSLCKSIKITYDKNIHNAYKAIFRKYSSYYKIICEIFITDNINQLTREDLYLLNNIKVNLMPIIKNIEYNDNKYQAFCKKYNISPEKSFAKAARTILISMIKLFGETNKLAQLIVQEAEALAEAVAGI